MADYTHEYSNFPSAIMTKKTYRDVTDADAIIINTIKEYQNNKDYASAARLIVLNPSIKECIPDSTDFNSLCEEIRNAEIYAKTRKQSIYYSNDVPDIFEDGDVWIGGN